MEVESEGVRGEEPDEASVAEDELASYPDGLEESESAEPDSMEVTMLLHLFALYGGQSSIAVDCGSIRGLLGEAESGDPDPCGCCQSHKDWRHEVRVVVAKTGDGGRRGEGTGSTGNLIEYVDSGIHSSKSVDVSSYDVGGAVIDQEG